MDRLDQQDRDQVYEFTKMKYDIMTYVESMDLKITQMAEMKKQLYKVHRELKHTKTCLQKSRLTKEFKPKKKQWKR